jgi:hypothetical protein
MKYKKEGQFRDAVATEKGIFGANGAAMLVMKLSKADIAEFNGTKDAPKNKESKKDAPKKKSMVAKIKDKVLKKKK